MAQGYFEIRFKKEDGSRDGEMLEKIIEWCKDQYDWFNEGIDEGQINVESALESVNNNGLVESEVPDDALETDWITEIFEEFHPVDMKAVQILGDGEYSEGPYSYREMGLLMLLKTTTVNWKTQKTTIMKKTGNSMAL